MLQRNFAPAQLAYIKAKAQRESATTRNARRKAQVKVTQAEDKLIAWAKDTLQQHDPTRYANVAIAFTSQHNPYRRQQLIDLIMRFDASSISW